MSNTHRSTASSVMEDEGAPAILYHQDSEAPDRATQWEAPKSTVQEVCVVEPDSAASLQPVPHPTASDVHEIVGLLKVKTSMLAIGACERIRKICRAHPHDICDSPILPELIKILHDGPLMPLAAAVLSALATLALDPEGRQHIVILGGAVPIIKLIQRCDFSRPNTARGVQLLMNLAADAQNRKIIREAGGCEALATLMKVCPLDSMMEQAMGALHNVMLTDSKAKTRAVEGGVAFGLARVLASKLDENHILSVRVRMLLADLLRVQDLQQRIIEAAQQMQIRIPGMMPSKRSTAASGGHDSLMGEPLSARGAPSTPHASTSMGPINEEGSTSNLLAAKAPIATAAV